MTSVTLCPDRRTPPYSLSDSSADDVPADQVCGPDAAVSTTWPCSPQPTVTAPGETVRAPADDCPGPVIGPPPGTRGGTSDGPMAGFPAPGNGLVKLNSVTPVLAMARGTDRGVGCPAAGVTLTGNAPIAPAPARRDADGPVPAAGVRCPRQGPRLPPGVASTITDATAAAAATAPAAVSVRPRGSRGSGRRSGRGGPVSQIEAPSDVPSGPLPTGTVIARAVVPGARANPDARSSTRVTANSR